MGDNDKVGGMTIQGKGKIGKNQRKIGDTGVILTLALDSSYVDLGTTYQSTSIFCRQWLLCAAQ